MARESTITILNSTTSSATPGGASITLAAGELAINRADNKLFYRNAAGNGDTTIYLPTADPTSASNLSSGTLPMARIADDSVTAAKLAHTSVTAGSYTLASITVDAQGRLTAASSGSGGGSDAFTVKVDSGATAGYIGAAIGDGVLRYTSNHFTLADSGDYVTLSLADHATARSALGLGSAATTASSDYATSAQGTLATNAMPKAGGTFTGNVLMENADELRFRDSALSISSSANQILDIESDRYVRVDVDYSDNSGAFIVMDSTESSPTQKIYMFPDDNPQIKFDANGGTYGEITTAGGPLYLTSDNDIYVGGNADAVSDIHINVGDGHILNFDENGTTRATFNLDSTPELDVTGHFKIDCSDDITLDADGGQINFADGSVGNVFTFDLSTAPEMNINTNFKLDSAGTIEIESVGDLELEAGSSGNIILDAAGDITLDADGSDITFSDGGTTRINFDLDSSPTMDVTGSFTIDSDTHITLDCGSGDDIIISENGGTYTPTSDNHVATKKYVDDNAGGGSSYDQDLNTDDTLQFGRIGVDNSTGHVDINNGYVEINGPNDDRARLMLFADQGEANADKFQLQTTNAQEFELQSKSSGSWVNMFSLTSAAQFTLGQPSTQNGRYQIVEGANVHNGWSGEIVIATSWAMTGPGQVEPQSFMTVTVKGGIITSVA